MGTNLQAIPNVFIGRRAIEIVQERHFAPLVVFSSVVGIEEERTAEIVEIEILYLTYEEAESFSSFDAIIHRNEQRLRRQHFEPRSCQLDGQRQTVQANSDLRQVRRFVIRDGKIRPDRKWPIDKEPHGIKLGEAFEGQPSIGSRKLQRLDRYSCSPRRCRGSRLVTAAFKLGPRSLELLEREDVHLLTLSVRSVGRAGCSGGCPVS